MKLYNTLTRQIEEFIPNNKNEVKMYTCGPTVYNYAHIGNLRTYISEDLFERTLNYLGYNVKRCMNITDVGHLVGDGDDGEDKMSTTAHKENKSVLDIADFYTECFYKDIDKLNVKKPEIVCKATENVENYIKMISKLIEKGYAYQANGNVYFDTSKSKNYYQLSNMKKEEMKDGVRDDVVKDEFKKNQSDFGLWFTNSKFDNQELKWESPFGYGYPGWHIECSAISIDKLGEHLDLHFGAIDAIFPHHTNEIAQSEAYLGHKWCNYWVHLEFLNDSTGKMSKSKGEFLTLNLLEEKGYNPLSYRYFILTSHYRNQLVFTYEALDQAQNSYNKLLNRIKNIKKDDSNIDIEEFNKYIEKFKKVLSDDLNTSNAITLLYDVIKSDLNSTTKLKIIEDFDKVLGLDLISKNEIDEDLKIYIEEMIEKRNKAKKEKDYNLADSIRDELKEKGIIIKDTREKTEYYLEV